MGVFNRLSQNHFKMSKTSRKEVFLLFTFFLQSVASQQLALGAGSGTGSCRAFPFRAAEVDWDVCPPQLPCCNEYGYCRTREEWGLQNFRDCNGASNGIELPDSVLELENAPGGEPGPGLGADSDFDKRQLEKVGSGSPAQRVNPFAPAPVPVQDFSNGGGSSAAGKAENSLLGNTTAAAAVSSSSSRDSSRRRRPSGKQASSGSVVGSRRRMAANRRQQSNQGSQGSQRNQGSQRSQGSQSSQRSQGSQSSQRSQGSQISQGSQGSQTPTQRPRSPARTTSSSRPRPSGRRPRPRPVTSGPRPLGQQSKTTTTRQVTGSGKTSVSGKSVGSKISSIRSSSSRSKTASSQTKDVKATDLYPLAAYKNTAGYPMNLNAENCPNYPFCYWNPYAAGAKD